MFKQYCQDLLDLVYPPRCLACENRLFGAEKFLCLACRLDLPRTDYEAFKENPVYRSFYGRFPVHNAAAWLHFEKGSMVQALMHEFKYKNRPDLAFWLGATLGQEWRHAKILKAAEVLIPVPLHPKKLRKRGYNQALEIARGLAKSTNLPLAPENLQRVVFRKSQTKESRYQRWEQVKTVFKLNNGQNLKGKHILLVDDVLTTGATIEACLHTLAEVSEARLSVLCLAHA